MQRGTGSNEERQRPLGASVANVHTYHAVSRVSYASEQSQSSQLNQSMSVPLSLVQSPAVRDATHTLPPLPLRLLLLLVIAQRTHDDE